MAIAASLGYPRIGADRELKRAVESYWAGKTNAEALLETASSIKRDNWLAQKAAGIDHIPSNDFSFYDQVLDMAAVVGAVPERYGLGGNWLDLDTYFAMARGRSGGAGSGVSAMEMTKWFDTNYHYLVPEFSQGQVFRLASLKPVDEFLEAKAVGVHTRPVLIGPLTFLLLGKGKEEGFDRLSLLDSLVDAYADILTRLAEAGADWVQMDEPALGLVLDAPTTEAYARAYQRLTNAAPELRLLVAAYFNDLGPNLKTVLGLPVAGVHLDLVRGPRDLERAIEGIPDTMVLSLGIVNGRNVWKTDLVAALKHLERAVSALGSERIQVAHSCSLLHAPVDLDREGLIDDEMRMWFAFARQKIDEVVVLVKAVNQGRDSVVAELQTNASAIESRRTSPRIHNPKVKARANAVNSGMLQRSNSYPIRREVQRQSLGLPIFPTTTIGSFPQTPEIRKARAEHRAGRITQAAYEEFLRGEVIEVLRFQEEVGLDVLVHGEPERNDMVEYFGEQMDGFVSSSNGWVQSYGSRCVKPPIIFGDVARTGPMTIDWITYAQSNTDRPVKGMLTGPVTILQWSFVRDDQSKSDTCKQIALAVRDEVEDLEKAGIRIIQIDEPALREGLPLRRGDWGEYLRWAVDSFRLTASGVADRTQIHTHMCYAEFNEIIEAITELDADVISMETSRSAMETLDAFASYHYPMEVGPGVYDIHSPRIATTEEMRALLEKAKEVLAPEQIWVNPDCGLKTRRWQEVKPSLEHMVEAAKSLR